MEEANTMKIIHKIIIFVVSTIVVLLLVAYLVSHIFGITDRAVATSIGAILLCIYIMCFNLVNDKTMWMKL